MITLSQGRFAFVDNKHYELLSSFKWSAVKKGNIYYAVRGVKKNDKWVSVYMHHIVLPRAESKIVDHIDMNGLNNQRKNLRLCTKSENQRNTLKHKDNTSGMKGVHWNNRDKKWSSDIMVNGKKIRLGYFKTKEDAYSMYCNACIKHHGKFARF